MSAANGKYTYKDASVIVNGVDLSQYVREGGFAGSREKIESTGMQAEGKEYELGDRDDQFTFTFAQSFKVGAVDDTLWPLFESGEEFVVELKHRSLAASATNPRFVGVCTLDTYTPLAGARNTLGESPVTMSVQGAAQRFTT